MTVDGSATLDDDLYALVLYLHPQCNRDFLEAITRERISFNGLVLLERLRGRQLRPTIKQAAALMPLEGAHTGSAGRIAERLANEGLVALELNEDDYRSKRITITDHGEELVGRLHAARSEQIHTFAEQLDDQEREQLQIALEHICQRTAIAALRRPSSA